MILFFRWLGRALFALLVLVLAASIFVAMRFEDWRRTKLAELDAASRVVETKAGPVEYAERGSGPVVLICHGAPGGYDQALLLGDSLAKNGFRVIAPSRPGFLRTPLTTGLRFGEQADALAALLDQLGVKRVAVLGFSTGSTVAMEFALRHPERTTALALVSPFNVPYRRDIEKQPPQILPEVALFGTTGDMGAWLFVTQAQRDPGWMLDVTLCAGTTLDAKSRAQLEDSIERDPARMAFFRGLVGTLAPLSPRESGTRNDILMVSFLDPAIYARITVPTLVVTGTAAPTGPWWDPKALPAAHSLAVAGAGDLVWLGPKADETERTIREFFTKAALSAPTPVAKP